MSVIRKFAVAGVLFLLAASFASAQRDIQFGPTSSGFNGGSITFTSNGNGTVDISLTGLNGGILPVNFPGPFSLFFSGQGSFSIANANLASSPFSADGESMLGNSISALSFMETETEDFFANPSGVAPVSMTGNILWDSLSACNNSPGNDVNIGGFMDLATSSGFFTSGREPGHTVFDIFGNPWFATFLPGEGVGVTLRTDLACNSLTGLFDSPAGTTLTTQVNDIDLLTPEPTPLLLLCTGFLAFPLVRRFTS